MSEGRTRTGNKHSRGYRATPFIVGRVDGKVMADGKHRRHFNSEDKAVTYIGTLPEYEQGVYYLEWLTNGPHILKGAWVGPIP